MVKRDSQVAAALKIGADSAVQITAVDDPVKAVRKLTPEGRGCDVVIEAVGRPQAWEWSIDMVRKGGTVNFFGGCASGTTVALDTQRLHYNELTLKATFHHTPETVRKAFSLICEKKIKGTDYITGEAPLSRLQQVLRHMLNRNGDIKTAIIPGHVSERWREQSAVRQQAVSHCLWWRNAGITEPRSIPVLLGRHIQIRMSSAPADNHGVVATCFRRLAGFAAGVRHSRARAFAAGGAAILRAPGAFALRKFLGRHLVSAQASAPALLQRLRLLPDLRRSGRRGRQCRAVAGCCSTHGKRS